MPTVNLSGAMMFFGLIEVVRGYDSRNCGVQPLRLCIRSRSSNDNSLSIITFSTFELDMGRAAVSRNFRPMLRASG